MLCYLLFLYHAVLTPLTPKNWENYSSSFLFSISCLVKELAQNENDHKYLSVSLSFFYYLCTPSHILQQRLSYFTFISVSAIINRPAWPFESSLGNFRWASTGQRAYELLRCLQMFPTFHSNPMRIIEYVFNSNLTSRSRKKEEKNDR